MTTPEIERLVVASRDESVLGTAVFAEREGYVHAWGVYVEPARSREGIGSRLMACLCGHTAPDSVIELSVLEASEKAARFYEALGFEHHASRVDEVFPGIRSPVRVMRCANATCRERLAAAGHRTNN